MLVYVCICSGSFVKYMIEKYFLSFHHLLLHKVFNFDEIQFIYFSLLGFWCPNLEFIDLLKVIEICTC
jgi:hypothetical protein